MLAIVEIINVEWQEPAEAPEIAPLRDPPAIRAPFGLELLQIHYNLERPAVVRTQVDDTFGRKLQLHRRYRQDERRNSYSGNPIENDFDSTLKSFVYIIVSKVFTRANRFCGGSSCIVLQRDERYETQSFLPPLVSSRFPFLLADLILVGDPG